MESHSGAAEWAVTRSRPWGLSYKQFPPNRWICIRKAKGGNLGPAANPEIKSDFPPYLRPLVFLGAFRKHPGPQNSLFFQPCRLYIMLTSTRKAPPDSRTSQTPTPWSRSWSQTSRPQQSAIPCASSLALLLSPGSIGRHWVR